MPLNRRSLTSAIAMIALSAAACSDSNTGPSAPDPIVGLSTNAKGSSSIQLSFNSRAGDTSYDIERAKGAAGAFAQITSIPAPATPGTISYTDAGLEVNTVYRYHVITHRSGLKSIPSGEASATTLT